MVVSYDIDGVLAAQPPPNAKKWGRMNGEERRDRKQFLYEWYENAEQLLLPKEPSFHTISARKREPRIFTITNDWMNKYYSGRVLSISLLGESRSVENVVRFKSERVLDLGVKRHYEDNKKVLRGMRKLLPDDVELYFWERGMGEPIPFR